MSLQGRVDQFNFMLDNDVLAGTRVSKFLTPEILNRFIEFEGKVPHFYLDGPGNVTIGIGCVVPTALAATTLNMYFNMSNLKAKLIDISNEYSLIKRGLAGQSISYYKSICNLYLPEPEIQRFFEFRLENLLNLVNLHMPYFKDLPRPAQEVVVDMAYNLGVSGLIFKFPRFQAALEKQNWTQAAKESKRLGIQDSRNEWAFNTLNSIEA